MRAADVMATLWCGLRLVLLQKPQPFGNIQVNELLSEGAYLTSTSMRQIAAENRNLSGRSLRKALVFGLLSFLKIL